MEKFAILVNLEAKIGREQELFDFLKSALDLVGQEPETVKWYAIQTGDSSFAIFDSFETEEGRSKHLSGPIAAALLSKASDLLACPPTIRNADIIAVQ